MEVGTRRKSRLKILYESNEIRRLMFRGMSNREIMDTLKVKRRTFYRYLERIYDEDRVEIEEQNRKNLATRIKLFRERLFDTINNCQAIATDTNVAPKDRINAESVKVQVSLVAFKLENEGFTSIRQRLEDAEFMNGTNKENYESYNEHGENKVASALSMLLEKKLVQYDNVISRYVATEGGRRLLSDEELNASKNSLTS